ncbi:PepSY-associated TM helix domain-containing protein [Hymenobacter cavernae]|uniref:Membrane protein n=1 Tax=Hymenobacter cavernae TaxID=2044852 RepID=A0ABQ1UNP2_9BACT|nr:PepSY-associated TM helix domain-containing protein [Hymenobacter cavernae]GGF21364.1 membrane protein [Hymenobacter cavernae]
MKVFFRTIHLYLSLVSGLVIAVVCFTGGVLVFEKELEQALHRERYFVAPGSQRLPLQQLVQAVQTNDPKAKVAGVKVYTDPARSVEVSLAGGGPGGPGKGAEGGREGRAAGGEGHGQASGAGEHQRAEGRGTGGKEGKGGSGGERGGPTVFVNPYTGAVLGQYVYRDTFFFKMFSLHRGILGSAVGKMIVGVSTLFFLVILATGIVLWWPATRKAMQQRLTVKWGAGWKRLNHDFHIVLGFYSALFLFVFAFTGLAWSFEWFNKGIYWVTNSPMQRPEPPTAAPAPGATLGFDQVYSLIKQRVPDAVSYAIQLPKEPTATIRVATLSPDAVHENASDELYLDQHSGEIVKQQAYADRNLGMRVRSTFKPVHTGAIFGLPSKIIAVIVCLLGTTFPITGLFLWLNRLKKGKKKQQKKLAVALPQ